MAHTQGTALVLVGLPARALRGLASKQRCWHAGVGRWRVGPKGGRTLSLVRTCARGTPERSRVTRGQFQYKHHAAPMLPFPRVNSYTMG